MVHILRQQLRRRGLEMLMVADGGGGGGVLGQNFYDLNQFDQQ